MNGHTVKLSMNYHEDFVSNLDLVLTSVEEERGKPIRVDWFTSRSAYENAEIQQRESDGRYQIYRPSTMKDGERIIGVKVEFEFVTLYHVCWFVAKMSRYVQDILSLEASSFNHTVD
jgi:hypothetical protein